MSFIDGLRHRVRVLFHRAEYERDLDEEIHFHLSVDAARNDGPDGARRRFGNVTYLKEETRRIAGLGAGDAVLQSFSVSRRRRRDDREDRWLRGIDRRAAAGGVSHGIRRVRDQPVDGQ